MVTKEGLVSNTLSGLGRKVEDRISPISPTPFIVDLDAIDRRKGIPLPRWQVEREKLEVRLLNSAQEGRLSLHDLAGQIATFTYRDYVRILGTSIGIRPFWRDSKPAPDLPIDGLTGKDRLVGIENTREIITQFLWQSEKS